MMFFISPACQGQIVEYAYAQAGDQLIRRITDRSDRSVRYEIAQLDDEIDAIEPWNVEPRLPSERWSEISAERVVILM